MELSKDTKPNEIIQIGNICKGMSNWDNPSMGRVYDVGGVSPTVNGCTGGYRQPYVVVRFKNGRKRKSSD